MPSKKVIVGLLGIFLAVSVVALIPVFMYGFTVNATEIEMEIGLSSGGLSTSSSQEPPSYDLSSFNVIAKEKVLSAYEYFFSRLGDGYEVEQEGSAGTEIVDILITFELITPTNLTLSFEFNPLGLGDQGLTAIMVLLGPEETNGELGTFYLTITITVTITLPVLELPAIVIDIPPVEISFDRSA